MMKKYIIILISVVTLGLAGCSSNFLDRPSLTTMNDGNYWTSENNLRLFANGFYPNYFVGYNSSFTEDYASLRGYYFSDDLASSGKQSGFETQAPASRGSSVEVSSALAPASWLLTYAGPTWDFAWVRKSNLFLERIETMKSSSIITASVYQHWSAVARFFRGFEYSRLVSVFGNVPYYDKVVGDSELDLLYKDRDDRGVVMDKVYDDFVYVLDNMRLTDGDTQYLNRYIAAGFISRFMLFEGTWQKYQLNNTEKAKKYLDLAVKAANVVMASGRYSFASDFRSLFGSESLSSNKEVILYRTYDAAIGVTHSVASYSNGYESQSNGRRTLNWPKHSFATMVNLTNYQQLPMLINWISRIWLQPVTLVLKPLSGVHLKRNPELCYMPANLLIVLVLPIIQVLILPSTVQVPIPMMHR